MEFAVLSTCVLGDRKISIDGFINAGWEERGGEGEGLMYWF